MTKPHTVKVHGVVTNFETKQPVAGAEVRIGARHENAVVGYAPTVTDDAGRYSVELEWDEHEKVGLVIDARAVGYRCRVWPYHFIQDRDEMMQLGTITSGEERQVDLEHWPGFALDVLVEDETGAPLPEAVSVVFCNNKEGEYCFGPLVYFVYGNEGQDLKSNSEGHLLWMGFSEVRAGERYVVSVQHEDYAEYLLQSPELLPRDNDLAKVTVRMSRGVALNGTVTGRNGKPLEAASINAVWHDRAGVVPRCHQISRTVRSDSEGKYHFGSLAPGSYTITAKHDKLAQTVVPEVEVAEAGSTLDIRLAPGATVSGTVLDSNGAPLPGVVIAAYWKKPEYGRKSTTTEENGTFRLDGLPARHGYTLVAYSPSYTQFYGFARLQGSRHGIVFDERALATVTGRLVDPATGAPVEAYTIITAWSAGSNDSMGYATASERDGSFRITVPASAGVLTVEAGDAHYALIKPKLNAGEVFEVPALPAQSGAGCLVRVVDSETSLPLPGAQVRVSFDGVWNRSWLHETNEKGEAPLKSLPPFRASMRVMHPDYEKADLGHYTLGSRRSREVTVRLNRKAAPVA